MALAITVMKPMDFLSHNSSRFPKQGLMVTNKSAWQLHQESQIAQAFLFLFFFTNANRYDTAATLSFLLFTSDDKTLKALNLKIWGDNDTYF